MTDEIARMVTHRNVDAAGCDRALRAVRAVVRDCVRTAVEDGVHEERM